MRKFYLLMLFTIYFTATWSQVVSVSGLCMTGPIVLSPTANVDGKVAFTGKGTVLGIPNIDVSVFWIAGTDRYVWFSDP